MSEFIGSATRGYKTDSTYETALLGGIYHSADQDFSADEPRGDISSARVVYRFVKNTDSGNITPGHGVKFDVTSANIYDVHAIDTATERGCGIADPDLASAIEPGERFFAIIRGPVDIVSGAAITLHDSLAFDNTGRAVTNDLSTVAKLVGSFGKNFEAATLAGQLRRAVVDFRTF